MRFVNLYALLTSCVCTAADFPFVAVTLFDCVCSIGPGIWEGEVRQMVWKFSVRPCGALGGDFIDEVSSAGDILQIILRKESKTTFCWHCPHSMRSRVYVTVRCPFVRLPHLPAALCCCGFAAVGPASRRYRSIAV